MNLSSHSRCTLSIAFLVLLSACGQTANPPQTAAPEQGARDASLWEKAAPETMGLKSDVLTGELTELLGANKTGAACLIYKGKLVWEHYWSDFGPHSRFDIYSAGKAFTGSAIGLLIDDGKLKLDDPACKYLKEWDTDDKRSITIRNLLTMTSGLKLDYEKYTQSSNPTEAMLNWPMERAPGTAWSYEQATSHALAVIVERITGKQVIVFLRERILDPIGVVEADWLRSRQGDCLGWRSVLISARELARFGQFYLNKGRWDGRQLLSEAFINQATVNDPLLQRIPVAPGQDDFRRRGYGFQMFVNSNGIFEGVDRRGYGFLGAFHNICLVDPVNDFVFVRMVTPEAQGNHDQYENALDVTDKGTAKVWRTVLSAIR